MSSTEPDRNRFVALPFTVVRKGYDRDEVRNYFDRFDAELRVTATDRDAAAAQAASRAVYRVYPLDPMPNTYWDATAALVLGAVGVLVQLAVTAKGRK